MALSRFVADCLVFLTWNIRHYRLALFGVRLRLDPDYPSVKHFFPSLLTDTVLEWRIYGFLTLWAVFTAWLFPTWLLVVFVILLAVASLRRLRFYSSSFAFWKRAAIESPNKFRVLLRYGQELQIEERRLYCRNTTDREEAARWAAELEDLYAEMRALQAAPEIVAV